MPNSKQSKKAVITGGSSGIGLSMVKKLLSAGYETVNADLHAPEQKYGHFLEVDLTRPDEIENFVTELKEKVGIPDILVCNAGQGVHEKLTEGDPDTWEHIFKLNVFSSFRLIRLLVPHMQQLESADVIFISSVSAKQPYTYGGIYSATKAAVNQIAETLRLEVQPEVRVTIIHPGVVDTGFFKNMINGSHTPEDIGWGSIHPDQIADSVLYALSQPKGIMLNDVVIRPTAQPM